MNFVYDIDKSQANRRKHGVDFEKAQELWRDSEAILDVPATSYTEERWLAIGRIDGEIHAAIYTYRGETIRLISVRRAGKSEREAYED